MTCLHVEDYRPHGCTSRRKTSCISKNARTDDAKIDQQTPKSVLCYNMPQTLQTFEKFTQNLLGVLTLIDPQLRTPHLVTRMQLLLVWATESEVSA